MRSAALASGALIVGSVATVDPSGLSPFGPAKWLVVSTLAFAAAALSFKAPVVRCERRSWWAWVALLALLAVASLVNGDVKVALLGHPDRHFGLLTWVLLLAVFCAGQQLASELRIITGASVIAAAVMGAFSLWELLVGRPIDVAVATRRLLGPFGSAAFLGAACCLLGPVAVAVALDRSASRWWRRVAVGAAALAAVALVGSGSRAAWLAAVVAAVIAAAATHPGRRTLIAMAAGLIVAVAVVAPRLDDVVPRSNGSTSRLDEWRVAARVIAEHPLIGVGPEGYRIAFAEGVDDAYERVHRRDAVLPDRAHSGPLDVALDGGIAAGLLYAGLLVFVGKQAWRAMRSGDALATGLAVGVVAYGVDQLLLFPLAELDPVWWLFSGVLVTMTARRAAGDPRRMASVTMAATTAVVAAVLLIAGVLDVAADRLARTALRSAGADASIDAAARAVTLRPDNMRYRLVEAEAHLERGTLADVDAAIDAARRATRWSAHDPFAEEELATAMSQRATITGGRDDLDAALAEWKRLVAVDPHRASWQLQLGRAAALAGDTELARRSWARAAALGEPGAQQLLDALDASR